jgi:hypothetical protein
LALRSLLAFLLTIGFSANTISLLAVVLAIGIVVALSMLISAINALTLSPAPCAILLKLGGHRRGPMGAAMRGIDGVRDGYAYVVARLVRFSALVMVLIAVVGFATGWLFKATPTGFLPFRDGGAPQRTFHPGGGDPCGAHAHPRGADDQLRLHPRPGATGHRERCRRGEPTRRLNRRFRRHVGGLADRYLPDPDALYRLPAGEGEGPRRGVDPAGVVRGRAVGRAGRCAVYSIGGSIFTAVETAG